MEILGKELSKKTASIVQRITDSARLPIRYFEINLRPGSCNQVAGSVDAHGTDGIYKVWLSKSLPQDAFEVDVLHELHHIIQVESGYSEIYNKDTLDLHSPDRDFVQSVGSNFSSVILDIEVNHWLAANGYSYEFFSNNNFQSLMRHKDHQYTKLNDSLNFAKLALALLHASLYIDDSSAATLFDAYSAYPSVVQTVERLRDALLATPVIDQHTALHAHCLLLDTLNAWTHFYVMAPNLKIRTHGEYAAWLTQEANNKAE